MRCYTLVLMNVYMPFPRCFILALTLCCVFYGFSSLENMIIIPLPRANSPLLTHTHITNFGIPPTHLFPSFFSSFCFHRVHPAYRDDARYVGLPARLDAPELPRSIFVPCNLGETCQDQNTSTYAL